MHQIKFKEWTCQDLEGDWHFTIKIDGIRAHRTATGAVSRNGTPLFHLPAKLDFEVAEIFCGDVRKTFSIVMASKSPRREVKPSEIYKLYPEIDKRLDLGVIKNPSATFIRLAFHSAITRGFEGLVLRQGHTYIKVKTEYTEDVRILDMVEGNGRLKGKMGKLITELGECGTGFSDARDLKSGTTKISILECS